MIETSDGSEQWTPTPCALHVYVEDPDAAYNRAVAAGATGLYEPTDHEYGERSGAVRDQFGNNWYIASYLGNDSAGELAKPGEALGNG
jgi:uncharacterized glyoxalase superfamily protein PhnB